MKTIKLLALVVLLVGFSSCKDDKAINEATSEVATGISTFYLIRHAEKDRTDDQNEDPELSQTGLGRAMHWAEIFNSVPLDAVYSTDYQRTSQTASPSAIKQDIDLRYYDSQNIDIEQFKTDNFNQNVLIVGHSNTTPDFANQLLGDQVYDQFDDANNGSLIVVTIINGMSTSQRLEINCSCPSRD